MGKRIPFDDGEVARRILCELMEGHRYKHDDCAERSQGIAGEGVAKTSALPASVPIAVQ